MPFQSDEQKYHILAKLSLIALYILLAYNLVAVAVGYFLAQANSTTGIGNTILRNVVFAVAVADLVVIFLIKKSMLNKTAKSQSRAVVTSGIEEYKKLLNITLVIVLMCAAISTYGLILVILGEKLEVLLLFVAASLLGYQFFRLRPRDFEEIERREE
jgi:hypothetical protein